MKPLEIGKVVQTLVYLVAKKRRDRQSWEQGLGGAAPLAIDTQMSTEHLLFSSRNLSHFYQCMSSSSNCHISNFPPIMS
jgi:hypothetical protein